MKKNQKYNMLDLFFTCLKIFPLQAIILIIFSVLNGLIPMYQTIVISTFINTSLDVFSNKIQTTSVIQPICLMMLYVLFTSILPYVRNIVMISIKNKMEKNVNRFLLLKRASLKHEYSENKKTQDLIHRVYQDCSENFVLSFTNFLEIGTLLISVVSLLLIVMKSNLYGGILIILLGIPLTIMSYRTGKKTYELSKTAKKVQRKYQYIAGIFQDKNYRNERVLFDYGNDLNKKFKELNQESSSVEIKAEKKTYLNEKMGSLILLLIVSLFTGLLIPTVARGDMSVGVFIALINVLLNLVHRMGRQLSGVMNCFSILKSFLNDFNQFLTLDDNTDFLSNRITLDFELNAIEFKQVSFKFPETTNYILKNCSFVLEEMNSYALVGKNGAGKSTIVKLLTGQYKDYTGDILINGINMKQFDNQQLKSIYSVIFQEFKKLELTIEENIMIGSNMAYSDEKMRHVLQLSGLEEWVSQLPKGIKTQLGKIKEAGIDISGGQWQKIAIARLLYTDSLINILDEPTAALDPISESKLYEEFDKINKNKCTLYITHRLGAAKMATKILVLDNGRIIEEGTHDELMKNKQLYYDMFTNQKKWYELSERNDLTRMSQEIIG